MIPVITDESIMTPAGFEPAPPKRTELKSVALDHSAIDTFTGNIGYKC